MTDDAPMQEVFNWVEQEATILEGIKFDPDVTYDLELDYDKISWHTVKRRDGSFVLRKDKSPSRILEIPFVVLETEVQLSIKDWYNLGKDGKPMVFKDSIIWKLAEKLGYDPSVGKSMLPSDFLKRGLKIKAKIMELPPNEQGRVYNAIDIDTIQSEGVEQQTIPEKIPDAVVAEIKALAKGCKKQSDLMSKINKAKKFELLQPAMLLIEQGQIKF